MYCGKRIALIAAGLSAAIALAGTGVAANATAAPLRPSRPAAGSSHLRRARFNLKGYVIDASYTRGRNTGNTFKQTYGKSMVQGVPVKGPLAGTKSRRKTMSPFRLALTSST